MKALLALSLLALTTMAQIPAEPPLLLQLVRKPGAAMAGEPLRDYASAKAQIHVLGMISMTGTVETWYAELHDSFASLEALDTALNATPRTEHGNGELLAPTRVVLAIFRPNLSRSANEALKLLPHARFFQVSIYQGGENAVTETIRQRQASLDVMTYDRPELAYKIISGDNASTYIFLAPVVSLATIDENMARRSRQPHGETTIEGEHRLLRVRPGLSYVSEGFAAEDPEFWNNRAR